MNTSRTMKVALAGNPNVGKSSLFNRLTGMKQHTGNWTGKTVECAVGSAPCGMTLIDLPGTYSLHARSAEEEAARDYIRSGDADVIVAVLDASNPERGLPLVFQIMELTDHVVVCVNLMDEAKKRSILPDIAALEEALGVPVAAVSARTGEGLDTLYESIHQTMAHPPTPKRLRYPPEFERELVRLENAGFRRGDIVSDAIHILPDAYASLLLTRPIIAAEAIACDAVQGQVGYDRRDRLLDKVVTHRVLSIPLMLFMLGGIFFLTVVGSNAPSAALSMLFSHLEAWISAWLLPLPPMLHSMLVEGILHTVFSVVAVMLPPMAIFFPLFTLAEDFGLLGRIAFNLDGPLRRCGACGKQALTMCMSLGCTSVGVMGCRIIDSPRERKLALLTASFMPCNGKFPILIALCAMLAGSFAPLVMVGLLLLAIFATFGISWLLSHTLLGGEASAFALELPPYRKPQILTVLVRSLIDRTLHVLCRAVCAAAPAGLIIWLLTNIAVGETPLLIHAADALDPIGQFFGLDGVILLSFVLGFPANELVLPLMLGTYATMGIAPAWSTLTLVNLMLAALFRIPCAASLLTIRKEAGGKMMLASAILPTVLGAALCLLMRMIWLLGNL